MLRWFVFVLFLFVIQPTYAVNRLYGVLSAGYSDVESDVSESDGVGYKFGIGYQFHRQWYVEGGYHLLSDESLSDGVFADATALAGFEPEVEAESLFISVLGKASSRAGELFYRLGINSVDVTSTSLVDAQSCDGTSSNAVVGGTASTQNFCVRDDTALAGHIGIGFDFRLGRQLMLRTEVEHLQGEDDLETTTFTLGVRYNF
ncbi:autotransporter outer membrane beta-barrel domain-containing protein [Alteromonadaceae bacterium M269]|nr:autotransporter outer membrane beta-barrel domain-containing protein [Alteromonadaceae bacterium M269]